VATARWGRGLAALALGLVGLCLGAVVAAHVAPLPARLALPGSSRVLWADGGVAHATLAPDDRWRIPADPARIDPDYLAALLAYEDARFRWHPGVDPLSVVRAAAQNLSAGRVVSGASTLTMQLVRLAEPRPRTLRSKALEAARAVQLELRMDKDEILRAYLTLAPFGGNLEGVETASWAYFGHDASALTAAEICVLLAVPQDPSGRAPRAGRDGAALRAARDRVAERLAAAGVLPLGEGSGQASVEAVLQTVRAAPVPRAPRPLPRAAPHAAAWMAKQPLGLGGGRAVETTLDRGTQALAERVVGAHAARLGRSGIDDVAVVVADWQTGEVRALVGGVDFWAERPGAQIPSFAVPRSPGSTLKPVLYAAAIDEGRVLPGFLVPDIPVRHGGYAPTNYDGRFDGMVRLEDALSRSLNVPFVELLGEVGVPAFLRRLRALGVESLDPRPGHYGLSLIVGGAELSPLDLATIYAALAADGRARPLRWRADAPVVDPQPVVSPGAAWLTRRALRLKDRPDFPARRELSAMPRGLHWKTGTSFGHRDAWAVGSGARYTVAVWLGNLDQRPSRRLVGAEAAGPLLFDVLEGLGDGLRQVPLASGDLVPVSVCALSGRVTGAECPHTREVLALETAVPTGACALHQRVEVDRASGLRVRPGCRDARDTEARVVVRWPAEVRRWLSDHHLAQPAPPGWAPGCAAAATGAGPRIVSPAAGAVALLIPGLPAEEQEIPFEAEAGEGPLHWFVDGVRLGSAAPEGRVWWEPRPGTHEVMVMDPAGRSARVRLEVREG
jgi:penicillin-binding protein 1C